MNSKEEKYRKVHIQAHCSTDEESQRQLETLQTAGEKWLLSFQASP